MTDFIRRRRGYFAGLKVTVDNDLTILWTLIVTQAPVLTQILTLTPAHTPTLLLTLILFLITTLNPKADHGKTPPS